MRLQTKALTTVLVLITVCWSGVGASAADPPRAGAIAEVSTAAAFDQAIAGPGVVVVDFFATWCGPCRMLAPQLERVAREHPADVRIIEVDVDRCPEIAARYRIRAMPSLVRFSDGKMTAMTVGYRNADELTQWMSLDRPE